MQRIKADKIIKTKRKTLQLRVDGDGKIIVRAPLEAPDGYIDKFIEQRSEWILEKKKEISRKKKEMPRYKFENGEKFKCFGVEYTLRIRNNQEYDLMQKNSNLFLRERARIAGKELIKAWYKDHSKIYFRNRTAFFADQLGLKYNQVKVSNALRKFASCSAKGNLNFSWRLALAPTEIADYIIIHELAHLVEFNHSKRFWKLVGKIMPDYKKKEKWLKDKGHTLYIEGF